MACLRYCILSLLLCPAAVLQEHSSLFYPKILVDTDCFLRIAFTKERGLYDRSVSHFTQ